MKTLLVGEMNPYGADPSYALYPYPRGATGHRLCSLIMGLTDNAYLRGFDRANVCTGKWSIRAARIAAAELARDVDQRPAVVLLGRRVCDAFSVPFEPFALVRSGLAAGGAWRTNVVVLPHPSGLNRMWLSPDAFARARAALTEAGALPVANAEPERVRCENCGVVTASGSAWDCQDCGRP